MQQVTPLKRILLSEGRSQSWLAREIGMSTTKICLIVNGLHADEDTRREICRLLGRDEGEVFPTVGAQTFEDAA